MLNAVAHLVALWHLVLLSMGYGELITTMARHYTCSYSLRLVVGLVLSSSSCCTNLTIAHCTLLRLGWYFAMMPKLKTQAEIGPSWSIVCFKCPSSAEPGRIQTIRKHFAKAPVIDLGPAMELAARPVQIWITPAQAPRLRSFGRSAFQEVSNYSRAI